MLVRSDGTRTELPCHFGSEAFHLDLATQLTSELARARATGQGYRGRVRVADDAPDTEAVTEADDASDRHASRS